MAETVKRSAGLVARMDRQGMRTEFPLGKNFGIGYLVLKWILRAGLRGWGREWMEMAQNHNQWRAFSQSTNVNGQHCFLNSPNEL